MKKLVCILVLALFTAGAWAQDGKVELSKEKKQQLKKMKEEHLEASFKEVELTEEQVKKAHEAIDAAGDESKKLKESALSDEEKEVKKKAINEAKNAKLREIMGEKYKRWNELRKKQKEEEDAFAGKG